MTTNRKKRRLTKTTASTPPTSTSKNFTNQTDELAFKQRHYDLNTTRVYHLRPPNSLSSTAHPWIATRETTADYNFIFRHPLTSKPHSFNLPPDFYFPQLNSAILAVFYAFRKSNSVDKLLVSKCNLFALYGGGQLKGRHGTSPWVKLSHRNSPWVKFDDIIDLKDKTYVVDRWGIINFVNHYKTVNTISIGKTLISEPVIPGSGQFGWRKRFAVDEETIYLVVRMEEKLFKVFRLKSEKRGGTTCFNWVRVWEFGGNKVLFMARDCYFFLRASRKFPGREYRNCIVFSEAAFPQYGKDGWEFTESGNVRRCEDDVAVFCLGDERFAREGEGEKSGFPKIDWSPPDWILNVSSFTEDEFSMHSVSESSVQSERVPDEDEGPDSDSGEKNDGEVQSGVMDSKTKDDEEQEVMEYDFVSQDQDQGGVESDSDSQDQEDEKMQCDLNSQEKEDEEMHSKEANAEHDNVSLQEDPVTPSRSAVEEEITRTLLRVNSENDAMEEETSGKNITYMIPKASTSATTEMLDALPAYRKELWMGYASCLLPIGLFGWRKRFVVDDVTLYLVIRTAENLFQLFRLMTQMRSGVRKRRRKCCFYWDRVRGFGGNKVLFMARDHYFFLRASRKFPGREYKNCIVFSEAAFPQYGLDCWEFTQSGDRQFSEDDIAVFRLDDEIFAREGEEENSGFPKIDWSPPDWIFNVSSFPAAEFMEHPESESFSQSERAPHEDEGLDPDSGEKNDGEVQSGLKGSNTKDEEQEVMEYDFGSQDQDQCGVESDSNSQDQEDEEMQCDSNSQEKDDEEMHCKEAIIEGDAPLQKDSVTPSRSAVEEEVTGTLLRMNRGKDAMEEETLGKNITQAIPKASTSSRTENHESDTPTTTTKFEGLDIRSDLVPTLQKIWRKHGNIIKDSIVRSGDIVARALESLAIMVRILEDNPAQSLSDSQADYLTSTLSDLRNICFKVYWLVPFVEKALKVHRSKPLVESLNNLSQLSSQVKERKTILLDELAKLNDEENKLREEMAKVSKIFYGQVNFDEPIGAGLT